MPVVTVGPTQPKPKLPPGQNPEGAEVGGWAGPKRNLVSARGGRAVCVIAAKNKRNLASKIPRVFSTFFKKWVKKPVSLMFGWPRASLAVLRREAWTCQTYCTQPSGLLDLERTSVCTVAKEAVQHREMISVHPAYNCFIMLVPARLL